MCWGGRVARLLGLLGLGFMGLGLVGPVGTWALLVSRGRAVMCPKRPALGTCCICPCRRRGSRSWALGILLWVSIRGLPGSFARQVLSFVVGTGAATYLYACGALVN